MLARFSIGRPDGVTWEDLTAYLSSATISLGDVTSVGTGATGLDERVRTAQFTLAQERTGQPAWPEETAREETDVVGDEADVVGDEAEGGERLINLLFATAHTYAPTSLSPRDRASEWNQFGGQYAPLIWPGRETYFEVALYALGDDTGGTTTVRGEGLGVGDGSTRQFATAKRPLVDSLPVMVYLNGVPASGYTVDYDQGLITFPAPPPPGAVVSCNYTYWLPLFHGLIDDWQTAGSTITIRCRDLAARLMDTYILEPREYGSEAGTPLEQVIQQILDDHMGPGVVMLYCPESPGFAVTPYVVEYQTVWEAIQALAAKTVGWFLGYRWREETGRFELTLLRPPREKGASTADWHLTADEDIIVNDLGGSIADLRNRVLVVYRDAATGERRTVTEEDPDSILEYGVRAMQIEEADTSLIDTEAEARALAQAAVADLKDQHATARLELPLLPMLDLMDGIALEDPRTSSTVDFYAVESVEHRLDWSDPERAILRTTAVCSGRVAGAHTRWLAMQTRPGSRGQPTRPPTSQAVPAPPGNLRMVASGLETVEQVTLTYLDVAWDPPANVVCDQYLLRWRKSGTAYWETVTVPRGTDASPQRIGRLPGNVDYEVQVAGISRAGVQGQWSQTLTATTPKDTQAPSAPPQPTATSIIRGIRVSVPRPSDPDWKLTRVRIKASSGGAAILTVEGAQTEFEITAGLQAGQTYYADAQYEDTSGNVSAWSAEVSAVAAAAGPALNTWHMEFGPDPNAPRRIAWRDVNNLLGIAIGDVRDLQSEMGSTMEFGLALLQGEIRASGAVLQQSLAPMAVESSHIAPGAIIGDAIPDSSIYPVKLSDWISVVEAGSTPQYLVTSSDGEVAPDTGPNTWYTLKSLTFVKRDNAAGRLMEVCRVYVEYYYGATDTSHYVTWRILVDGQSVAQWTLYGSEYPDWRTHEVILDARSWSDGSHTVQFQVNTNIRNYIAGVIRARNFRIYQNNQLPIRFGQPMYTFATGGTGGCYVSCQVTSQSSTQCGNRCEGACQISCKSACETGGCQSTCERTSQGGGGCIREGTPITVWDPETQEYLEVPVERLQPGMILPRYDPLTDTITHSRLVELRDAKYSPVFIRIHTDVGPSIDVTWEQPFDVLADRGQGERVYRLQARDLQPGMKLFRPFDEPGRRIATITRVETVKERPRDLPGVHFWWPITDGPGYIVAGYGDVQLKQ